MEGDGCGLQSSERIQWEQVDLVLYYDDSNMVKVGLELVDGQLSIVMGREEKDATRTISITPVASDGRRAALSSRRRPDPRVLQNSDERVARSRALRSSWRGHARA